MSNADDVFYRQFGAVLILIVVFALAAGYLANSIGGDALAKIKQNPNALNKRIAPIGTLVTADMAQPVAAATAAQPQATPAAKPAPASSAKAPAVPTAPAVAIVTPAAATPAPAATNSAPDDGVVGRKTYMTACFACHQMGVANSPKLGDNAAWSERAKKGLDALYTSGIKGKGNLMPAKGGNVSLSDDAVKAAVRYMLKEAGVNAG